MEPALPGSDPRAGDVLDFWFGAPGTPQFGLQRSEWFLRSEDFDARVRERFGTSVEAALAGDLQAWAGTPAGALALLLLLDQFPRNLWRGTPRAFAGDARALALAETVVGQGWDRRLLPVQRWFVYLPFEHAEDEAAQQRSVDLFTALVREAPGNGAEEALDYALRHQAVIRRFGRFPHRNAVLGRADTPEEAAFLLQPGSRF